MHSEPSTGIPDREEDNGLRRASPEPIPASIDGYRVDGVLGRGGTGIVLRVHDLALDRPLALKLLADALDEDARARFTVEARAAGRIVHPNVVQVYAVGVYRGRAYITQELVEGHPLSRLLEVRRALSPAAVIDIGIQAARGLARAAEVGVVHRDVKPQNLLVTEEGLVKLADFGLAKLLHAPRALTASGTTLGTPHYMSPEQGLAKELDARSDQYALGATLYHLVTGQTPFDASSSLAILLLHVQQPLVPVRERAPECPPALAKAIERMLSKDPADRFVSFEAAIGALEIAEAEIATGDAEPPHEVRALFADAAAKSAALALDAWEPTPAEEGAQREAIADFAVAREIAQQKLFDRLGVAVALFVALAVVAIALRGREGPTVTSAIEQREASIKEKEAARKPAAPARIAQADTRDQARPGADRLKLEREPPKSPKVQPGRIEALIEDLARDAAVAARAAKELGALGDQRATMPLIRMLESARAPEARRAAAEALGRLGDTRAIGPLRAAQASSSAGVRDAAIQAERRLFRVEED